MILAYIRRIFAVCPRQFLTYVCRMFAVCSTYVCCLSAVCPPYVRRMSTDHSRIFTVYPPYIRHMSTVCPPYLFFHFPKFSNFMLTPVYINYNARPYSHHSLNGSVRKSLANCSLTFCSPFVNRSLTVRLPFANCPLTVS